ncbi:hypothetical protein BJV82DRAFT_108225 [Fennellomyces sp. T-0311]|nr:hypothetical protein BJV82DRAFT_108225 [Fennellomyces sp. T-0311]
MPPWNMKNPPPFPVREQHNCSPALPMRDDPYRAPFIQDQRHQAAPLLSAPNQRSPTPMSFPWQQAPSSYQIWQQHRCNITNTKLVNVKIVYVQGLLGSRNLFQVLALFFAHAYMIQLIILNRVFLAV